MFRQVRHFSLSGYVSASPKTGILMMNMGGPRSTDEVEGFLTNLFTDRDIIQIPFQSIAGRLENRK